jgi:hypothetical protein
VVAQVQQQLQSNVATLYRMQLAFHLMLLRRSSSTAGLPTGCAHLLLVALKAMYSSSLLQPAVSSVSREEPPPTNAATQVLGPAASSAAAFTPLARVPVWWGHSTQRQQHVSNQLQIGFAAAAAHAAAALPADLPTLLV